MTRFMDHGLILLPQLHHAFDSCPSVIDRIMEDPIRGYTVLLVLILSAKLPGLDWKLKAIDEVERALGRSPALGQNNTDYIEGFLQLRNLELSNPQVY